MKDSLLAPSQRVTVQLAGGRTSQARVVETRGEIVYVTTEDAYRQAQAHGLSPEALLGFRLEDVVPG